MLEQPGRTIVSLRRSLLLALVAAPLPLVGDLAMELAMKKWLSSYPSPGSWLALFLAAGLYYYLVSPLSAAIAAAHTRDVFRIVFSTATYVYLVLFMPGFAVYALILAFNLAGILPYLLVLLGSILSAWIGLGRLYRERMIEEGGDDSRLRGLGPAFLALFLAWIAWGIALVALYTAGLNSTIYDAGLRIYYEFSSPRLIVVTGIYPLARITIASLGARFVAVFVLAHLLEPSRKLPGIGKEPVYSTYYPWMRPGI